MKSLEEIPNWGGRGLSHPAFFRHTCYQVPSLGALPTQKLNNEKHRSANPLLNLTVMLHVLGEHTGMKAELYQTNVKGQGFIYRASFQHRLH